MHGKAVMGRGRPGRRGVAAVAGLALLLGACVPGEGAAPVPVPAAAPVLAAGAAETVLYVTDRGDAGAQAAGGRHRYSYGRSASMAFGVVGVGFAGADATPAAVGSPQEVVRFPITPVPFSRSGGFAVQDPAAAAAYRAAGEAFKAGVASALKARGQRDVLLFVHGYRNSFADSVTALADIWDAAGRAALPVAYSWPADNPAPFGYFKDRESGEFSIFHLKETLRLLAEVEGLEHIQLVAHSRGTDVATSALREMVIAARAAGRDPLEALKIDNLILAAPDLDFEVVRQRLIAEQFGPAFECITVYMNPSDGALGFAQALMSGTRFGRLSYADLPPNEREIFQRIGNVYFIDVSSVARRSSHDYFRNNPRVMADIVTVLNTSEPPRSPVRGLVHEEANFWRIERPSPVVSGSPRAGDGDRN